MNHHWTREWYKWRPHYTHKNLLTDLRQSKPKNYTFPFVSWMIHHSMSYSRLLPLHSIQEGLICRKQSSQSVLNHSTMLFGHWKTLFSLCAISLQSTGMLVLVMCLELCRQTVAKRLMHNTVHRLLNLFLTVTQCMSVKLHLMDIIHCVILQC
jgi:hypothetical protein